MKKSLMLAGVISCVMIAFSIQVTEAKEPSAQKVWNGSEYGGERTKDHPGCPSGEQGRWVEQLDGSDTWECYPSEDEKE